MKKETPACLAQHPKTLRWFVIDAKLGDYNRAAGRARAEIDKVAPAPIVAAITSQACLLALCVIWLVASAFPWWLLLPIAPSLVAAYVGVRRQQAREARAVSEFGQWLDRHNAQPVRSVGRAGVENIAHAVRRIHDYRREVAMGARWGGMDPDTGATELEELTRAIRRHAAHPGDRTLTAMGRCFERAERAYERLVACYSYDIQGKAQLSRIMARSEFPKPWRGPRQLGWI